MTSLCIAPIILNFSVASLPYLTFNIVKSHSDCFSIDDFKDMLHDKSESLVINLKIQVGA